MSENIDLQKIAKQSNNFSDFQQRATVSLTDKQTRQSSVNLFLLAKSCPTFAIYQELAKEIT